MLNLTVKITLNADVSIHCSGEVRLVIFRWDQGYVSPAPQAILDTTGPGDYLLAPYSYDNIKNYTIIKDRIIRADNIHSSATDVATKSYTFKVPTRGLEITYNADTTGSSDKRYFVVFYVAEEAETAMTAKLVWSAQWVDV